MWDCSVDVASWNCVKLRDFLCWIVMALVNWCCWVVTS